MTTERFTGSQTDALVSDVDLTGKEFFAAQRTATGVKLAGAGERVDGVISEGKVAGQHSSIKTGNQLKGIAGALLSVGMKVTSDGNGKFVEAAATQEVFGTVIIAAGAANDLAGIEVDRHVLET